MQRHPSTAEQLESMVAALRNEGMSATEISRAAQLSRTTVWRIVVGESRIPSAEAFNRIEAVYRSRCMVAK